MVPSGTGEAADGLLQMLLALINAAQNELILTTPYFVPDESLLCVVISPSLFLVPFAPPE